MAFSFTAFQTAIYTWASTEGKVVTIWDKPNVTRPKPPYITLMLLGGLVKFGGQDEIGDGTGDTLDIVAQRTITVVIAAYGAPTVNQNDPIQRVSDLQVSLGKPSVLETLRKAGIAVINEDSVLDTSLLLETGFEPRANMQVTFGVVSNITDDMGAIESTNVTGTVSGTVSGTPIPTGPGLVE